MRTEGQYKVLPEAIPVHEYVRGAFVPLSHLAGGWEMHSAVPLTPAEERMMVREPAQALPLRIVERMGRVRVLLVPFIACHESGDAVAFEKPDGKKHSAVWLRDDDTTYLILSCRDIDPHDTGFEFLASLAELLRARLTPEELDSYSQLLRDELRRGIPGEIDEEALGAKQPVLDPRTRRRSPQPGFENYRDVSFSSTLAEYLHGLWHDVQIRVGPDHLPLPALRRRMMHMARMFPPNPGYRVFAEELDKEA